MKQPLKQELFQVVVQMKDGTPPKPMGPQLVRESCEMVVSRLKKVAAANKRVWWASLSVVPVLKLN